MAEPPSKRDFEVLPTVCGRGSLTGNRSPATPRWKRISTHRLEQGAGGGRAHLIFPRDGLRVWAAADWTVLPKPISQR